MSNPRIKRDLDDRLAERAAETKERMLSDDPEARSKRERIEAFRDKW